MENLFAHIQKFGRLTEAGKDVLQEVVQLQELPKGHMLYKPHQVSESVCFIEKGLARTFYRREDKEFTERFHMDHSFVFSVSNFLFRRPDHKAVELLEDSVVYMLPYEHLRVLYDEKRGVECLGRHLMSGSLAALQERIDELQSSSARQRYERFVEANPVLMQRVPLRIIASYLGITQETLSRTRSSVMLTGKTGLNRASGPWSKA